MSVLEKFGKYDLLWNDCQNFLRVLAKEIVVAEAAEYDWFYKDTKTKYRKTQHRMSSPVDFLLKMQQQMTAQIQTQQINLQQQTQLRIWKSDAKPGSKSDSIKNANSNASSESDSDANSRGKQAREE